MRRIFVSDDVGQLKQIDCINENPKEIELSQPVNIEIDDDTSGIQSSQESLISRKTYIQRMCMVPWHDGTEKLALVRRGGHISVIDPIEHTVLLRRKHEYFYSDDAFCSLQEHFGHLVGCTVEGRFFFLPMKLAFMRKDAAEPTMKVPDLVRN